MAQTPEQMEASMLANIEAKTGKPLERWLALVANRGFDKHGQIVAFLKGEHGMTHGYANLVAHRHRAGSAGPAAPAGGDDVVDAQYRGPKAGLRAIYDALVAAVSRFGDDVELAPKKAYVSLRRTKQFGLIQPSTKTRVDVGIVLKGTKLKGRLEASGSFNQMVTHRVRVESAAEVDAELRGWLRQAYDEA